MSPLTTNLTDRKPLIPAVLIEKTQEEEDEDEENDLQLKIINTEEYYAQEESSIKSSSPKFRETDAFYLNEIENIMKFKEQKLFSQKNTDLEENYDNKSIYSQPFDYDYSDRKQENQSKTFIEPLSSKRESEYMYFENYPRPKNKSFSYAQKDKIETDAFLAPKKCLNEVKNNENYLQEPILKEKQFSFAETNNNSSYFEEKNPMINQKKQEKEKNLYETILQKVFNERNIQNNNNIYQSQRPNKNSFLKKNSISTTKKSEKKLNRREVNSYIEKIMTEAHRHKENKENNEEYYQIKHKKNEGIQPIQNTIIITNNSNYNNNINRTKNSKHTNSERMKQKGGVFHLTLGHEPIVLAVNMDEKCEGSQRKKSGRRKKSISRRFSQNIH